MDATIRISEGVTVISFYNLEPLQENLYRNVEIEFFPNHIKVTGNKVNCTYVVDNFYLHDYPENPQLIETIQEEYLETVTKTRRKGLFEKETYTQRQVKTGWVEGKRTNNPTSIITSNYRIYGFEDSKKLI